MRGRRRGRSDGAGAVRQAIAGVVLLAAAAAVASAAVPPSSASPLAPPPPPQRVDGLLRCSAERVLRPLSTSDVARMVSELYKEALALGAANETTGSTASSGAAAAAPPPIRIRTTHSRFHTPTTLACPGEGQPQAPEASAPASLTTKTASSTAHVTTASAEGADARSAVGTGAEGDDGGNTTTTTTPKQQTRVALLTDGLDSVLEVQPLPIGRMRVQAGMTVAQLLAAASAVGLSVPVGALPPFSGLTLGGLLATAAHGTGPTSLADMVVEVTWVDGTGRVHNSSLLSSVGQDEKEGGGGGGRALVGGLGLTGAVTELLLQLTPPTLTHALVAQDLPDDDLYTDVRDLLRSTPHVTVVWRPDLKRYSTWALYSETERQAERRRRRERRERLDRGRGGGGGGSGGGGSSGSGSASQVDKDAEEEEKDEDARATAAPIVVASAPPAALQSLLAWQRDANLQGGKAEEAGACASAKGQALAEVPFAYPSSSSSSGWRLRPSRSGGGRERGGDEQPSAPSSGLLSLLRFGHGGRGGGRAEASPSPSSSPAARIPATDRFTSAFIGPTNAMAAAGCSPSAAAAAKKGAAPMCAWVGTAPPSVAAATAATQTATATATPASVVRASRGGSGFHLALDLSQLETWIDDARWAVEADLQDDSAIPFGAKRCLPPGGFVLRFGAGLAGGEEDDDAKAAADGGGPSDASGNDDRDVRMDLVAAPDPAQLDEDAREEAADDEAAAAAGLLPLPPVLVASGAGGGGGGAANSSVNGTASSPPAVLEVDEVSAAGLLSPVAGLKRPVWIQAIAATYEEEGGGAKGSGSGTDGGAPTPAPTTTTTTPPTTTKYGWVIDALERFTYCAYNTSAPHWGDSSERALLLAAGGGDVACGAPGAGGGRLPGFEQQLEAQRQYDPLRLFEPELFRRVRQGAAAAVEERRRRRAKEEGEDAGAEEEGEDDGAAAAKAGEAGGADGCAADGRCWCTEDRHCAPGFGCVESNAYSGVMVCKPWAVIAAAETAPADDGDGEVEEAPQR